ncbi:MAG TPA: alkaline phosphatase family protein [Pirellulales bacterium]|nr:alkaline phosphatase family protein [Pirellulales bacterium]
MTNAKIVVVGLDCATPELLLGDERLVHIRRLMAGGCFGRLESVVPPITVPAWMCMATSQDPGSLGVYGFRNRVDHSYGGLAVATSASIRQPSVWDQIAQQGGRTNIVGVPPNYPPRPVNGVSVGCFLTPDTTRNRYASPAEAQGEIERLVGVYPVDVAGFRTHDKERLRRDIDALSRRQWTVARHLLRNTDWDYFQFVEIGLDRIQHGFWKCHDPQHVLHEPGNPYLHLVRDYYRRLDDELGQLLDLLDDETIVLVCSDHGARRLDGGFCVNEWLLRRRLLALDHEPSEVTPFSRLAIDWSRTKVWSEGGYYARVFINVRGREPQGTVAARDYEAFRDELKALLEATVDPEGNPLGTIVFKPEEIYRQVRGVAPDLIVHFGGLAWRSIGGVGYRTLHVRENDTGPDDCNHAQYGAFVLSAPNFSARGEREGVHLLDMAPTLLELGGYDVPRAMQGRSLATSSSRSWSNLNCRSSHSSRISRISASIS